MKFIVGFITGAIGLAMLAPSQAGIMQESPTIRSTQIELTDETGAVVCRIGTHQGRVGLWVLDRASGNELGSFCFEQKRGIGGIYLNDPSRIRRPPIASLTTFPATERDSASGQLTFYDSLSAITRIGIDGKGHPELSAAAGMNGGGSSHLRVLTTEAGILQLISSRGKDDVEITEAWPPDR
jgi:hypothetical protein